MGCSVEKDDAEPGGEGGVLSHAYWLGCVMFFSLVNHRHGMFAGIYNIFNCA